MCSHKMFSDVRGFISMRQSLVRLFFGYPSIQHTGHSAAFVPTYEYGAGRIPRTPR